MKVVFPCLKCSIVVIVFILFFCYGWGAENVDSKGKYLIREGKANPSLHRDVKSRSHIASNLKEHSCSEGDRSECDKDNSGIESIRTLHRMLDDDHNGNVDQSESDEFLRDELQYTDGFERQALFHNNDKLISVDDLWKAWKNSVVYNWTVDDVIEWLIQDVDLPQYSHVFHSNAINGSILPRLVNATGPLLTALGIRNPVHKQKLSLKAMDTVLFGAPKRIHSYVKDLLLVTSLIIAIGGCWFACLHHRYSQTQVKKMMKDLESLQKAEEALKKLSNELSEAEKNQKSVPPEKQEEMRMLRQSSIRLKLPRRTSHSGEISPSLSRDGSIVRREGEMKLKQAEEEIMLLRDALSEAETKLEIHQQLESQWCAPGELQAWLQLTYELEQLHYTAKHQAAERQLSAAKEGCDKIKKRNKAFLGSLRMAHSNSLDDIDQSILNARGALEEVKQDLEERRHRWHTIELLCGFSVITNPGLPTLKLTLGRDAGGSRLTGSVLAPMPIEETDEELPAGAYMSVLQNGMHSPNRPNTLSAGYSTLQPSGASKSFLKQPNLGGSTNSLSHVGKVSTTSSGHGGSHSGHTGVHRRESRENEYHASSLLGVTNPVSFHLGDGSSSHHERTHSNVSASGQRGVTPAMTNGHSSHHPQQHHHHPHSHSHHYGTHSHPHSKMNAPNYLHTNSYPPYSQKNVGTPPGNGMSSSHSMASSYGSMASAHKNGMSHAGSASSFRSAVPNSASMANYHSRKQEDGSTHHRPETLSLNTSGGMMDDSEDYSPDFVETGSNAGSATARSPLERNADVDISSMETVSINSASAMEVIDHQRAKKSSKKKKLFPFLRKSSSKHKNL